MGDYYNSMLIQFSLLLAIFASASERGRCIPCAFQYTKGCVNGSNSKFCRDCDEGEAKVWDRLKKRFRTGLRRKNHILTMISLMMTLQKAGSNGARRNGRDVGRHKKTRSSFKPLSNQNWKNISV